MTILVGKQAPEFVTAAVVGGTIHEHYSFEYLENKNILLIFYPLDFTFVCPTELIAFQEAREDFEKRGTEIIACSVDSVYTHLAWLNTPQNRGGIQGVTYPLLSDLNKTIARSYGVLLEDKGVALRGLFLIDKERTVRHQIVNDLALGRSVDEALRMVDALDFHEKYGDVCPADWKPGHKAMKPNQEGLETYFAG